MIPRVGGVGGVTFVKQASSNIDALHVEPKGASTSVSARAMPEHGTQALAALLERCAQVVGMLHTLPCVATMDWCERAAATLAPLATQGDIAVAVLDVRTDGTVRTVLAAGGYVARDGVVHREQSIAARCRVEALKGHPWAPAPLAPRPETIAGWIQAQDLARSRPPHSAMWQVPSTGSLIFASAGVGSPASTRRATIYLSATHSTGEQTHHDALVLQQAATVLASLAAVALGKELEPIAWLTAREQQVLAFLVRGQSVKEIAEDMRLSVHTVHDYVKSLHRKLRANSRGELVARAVGKGRTEALSTPPGTALLGS